MSVEKKKNFMDFIKMVSPGTALRNVIDDLINAGFGAMIIFDNKALYEQNILEIGRASGRERV